MLQKKPAGRGSNAEHGRGAAPRPRFVAPQVQEDGNDDAEFSTLTGLLKVFKAGPTRPTRSPDSLA